VQHLDSPYSAATSLARSAPEPVRSLAETL
jgi:hypothetical protein